METTTTIRYKVKPAFSLIETITVLVISALVLITAINIYTSVRAAAASVENYIVKNELPNEILQRLAEDIDRLAIPGFDTTISIAHKLDSGYQTCRMIITNHIYDSKDKKQTYEEIVWQTAVDPFYDTLNLYRLHTGMNTQKKIASEIGDVPYDEGEIFVRMAIGLTHFTINVVNNEQLLDRWAPSKLPKAIFATISFSPLQENEFGEAEIPEEYLISRTIAVDRTRTIAFEFVAKDFSSYDPNDTDAYVDPKQAGLEL